MADNVRFARFTSGSDVRLALVGALPRGGAVGYGDGEGWVWVSGVFSVPPRGRNAAIGAVRTTWGTYKASSVAVLTEQLNAALNTAGYRQANGAYVGADGPAEDVTLNLDAVTVYVRPQELTVEPLAAAVSLTGPTVTVSPGTVTVDDNPPELISLTGPTITVTPRVLVVNPIVYQLGLTAPTVSVAPGVTTVVLSGGSSWGDGAAFLDRPSSSQIVLSGQSNVVIEDLRFQNIPFNTSSPSNDHICIALYNCTNVTVRYCDFDTVGQPLAVFGGSNITVEWCRARDITGPHERYGTQNGNFLQTVNGPTNVYVQDNKIVGGDTEDIISFFSASDSIAQRNHIQGARSDVTDGGWTSGSGTGIIVGDGGGDDCQVLDNILYLPGQVGIGVAGGERHIIDGNTIYQPSQTPRAFSNVGIYTNNYHGGAFSGHEITNNNVRVWSDDQSVWNGFWNNGGTSVVSGNDFSDSSLDSSDLSVSL